MVPPNPNPDLQPTLVELLLPHLGSMRNFANLLYFDALVAARDGDHDRVYENLSAMLAMSRQQSFDGTIIADLVNIAIAHLTNGAMEQVLNEYPETLSREHLVALSHELTLVRPSLYMSFEGERMMFDDVLQRTYTDDGNGNGRLTLNGAQILTGLNGDFIDSDLIQANPLQILTGPVALTVAPDRRTQHTMFHSTMDLIERVQSDGPRLIALLQYHEDTLEANSGKIAGLLYTPVDLLLPALSRAVDRVFQAQLNHQASITMLALEIYRIDTGTYPNSLSELTPNYLPDLPADSFNPGHPLRYLPTDSGYKLYSVSSDADDDLGVPPEDSPRFPNFHDRFRGKYDAQRNLLLTDSGYPVLSDPTGPDGDWILIEIDRQQQ
jgi:hypothetical protein